MVPAFDAELMALIGNGWAIFPLVIAVLLFWLQFLLAQKVSVSVANLFIVVAGVFYPASLGVLSITRAPDTACGPVFVTSIW